MAEVNQQSCSCLIEQWRWQHSHVASGGLTDLEQDVLAHALVEVCIEHYRTCMPGHVQCEGLHQARTAPGVKLC